MIAPGHDGVRAPCPDRYYGLEGQRVRQVCKAPVRPVLPITDKTTQQPW